MTRVTDLDDARTNKALGIPGNTPVEHMGELPKEQSKLIASVLKAAIRILPAARWDGPQAPASILTRVRSRRRLQTMQSAKLTIRSARFQR